jgi:hypothetical protein
MDITKAADQATNALSTMMMVVAQQEPESPVADAIQQMIMAIGEIQARFGGEAEMSAANPDAAADANMPGATPVTMSGNPGMAQAATEAASMMNKRPPMMGR